MWLGVPGTLGLLESDAMFFIPLPHGYLCSPHAHPEEPVWLETLVAFAGFCAPVWTVKGPGWKASNHFKREK